MLLWAYYANGFDGVALEFEVDDSLSAGINGASRLISIRYEESPTLVSLPLDVWEAAYENLSVKHGHWAHEKEVRILKISHRHIAQGRRQP